MSLPKNAILPYRTIASNLHEGDVILPRQDNSGVTPYEVCTVRWVEHEGHKDCRQTAAAIYASPIKAIHVLRPYVHHSEFVCGNGTICYLGYEEYSLYPTTPVTILQFSDIPEVKRERDDLRQS